MGSLRPTHWFPFLALLFILTSSPGSFLAFTPGPGLTPPVALSSPPCPYQSSFNPASSYYQTKLGSACPTQQNQSTHQVVVKKSTAFVCRVPTKENGQLLLKRPGLPSGFQARVFKGNTGMRVVGCVVIP